MNTKKWRQQRGAELQSDDEHPVHSQFIFSVICCVFCRAKCSDKWVKGRFTPLLQIHIQQTSGKTSIQVLYFSTNSNATMHSYLNYAIVLKGALEVSSSSLFLTKTHRVCPWGLKNIFLLPPFLPHKTFARHLHIFWKILSSLCIVYLHVCKLPLHCLCRSVE